MARRRINALARSIIDSSRYMTLATADAEGRPWATPVWFAADRYAEFYWVSSPDAKHSRNIEGRGEVAITLFDSTVAVGAAEAVYMIGDAGRVAETEFDAAFAVFAQRLEGDTGGRSWQPKEALPPSPLRLYKASISSHYVLIRGSDPLLGTGIDRRVAATPAEVT